MMSHYQEKGCRKQTLIKPKGIPQNIHTESGGRTKQSVAVDASVRDRPTKAGKMPFSQSDHDDQKKLSLAELSSLCRLAEKRQQRSDSRQWVRTAARLK